MKHLALAAIASVGLLTIGCGGDDGDGNGNNPDAAVEPANPGFATPTSTARAWNFTGGQWVEIGPADFSCLGTPTGDVASTVDINLAGAVEDFQNGTPNANAQITAFPGVDFATALDEVTADVDGNYALTLPAGQTRVGFKVIADRSLETYLLNQYFDPAQADQTATLNAVSEATANTLPAFVGVSRTAGLGVLAAAIRDCNGDEVSDTVATVSGVSGQPEHLEGARSFYFSAGSPSLPVRNTDVPATNSDGLFVVLELPPSAQAFLQVWGFRDGQDPATDDLTLIAEIPSPVIADSVITASLDPLRAQ